MYLFFLYIYIGPFSSFFARTCQLIGIMMAPAADLAHLTPSSFSAVLRKYCVESPREMTRALMMSPGRSDFTTSTLSTSVARISCSGVNSLCVYVYTSRSRYCFVVKKIEAAADDKYYRPLYCTAVYERLLPDRSPKTETETVPCSLPWSQSPYINYINTGHARTTARGADCTAVR